MTSLTQTNKAGRAFGVASTVVAQMGILLGMVSSQQPQLALIIASSASAISGSFGDAFSMFVSESTAKREAYDSASSVFNTKITVGLVYVAIFMFFKNPTHSVMLATLLSLSLIYFISLQIVEADPSKSLTTVFGNYVGLTTTVVLVTSTVGFFIRRFRD
jgi:hypothetical protein